MLGGECGRREWVWSEKFCGGRREREYGNYKKLCPLMLTDLWNGQQQMRKGRRKDTEGLGE